MKINVCLVCAEMLINHVVESIRCDLKNSKLSLILVTRSLLRFLANNNHYAIIKQSKDAKLNPKSMADASNSLLRPIIYQSKFHEKCNRLGRATTTKSHIDWNKLIQIVKLHIIPQHFMNIQFFPLSFLFLFFNFIPLTSKFHVIMLCSRLPLIFHRYVHCVR